MGSTHVHDLVSLDRDVASASAALEAWRRSLGADPDEHADDDPFDGVRHVAGKSTWDALAKLAPSAADLPLRDALRRWVYSLTQSRIGHANDVMRARAAAKESAPFAGENPRRVSWRGAWRGVAAARTVGEAGQWLDAAADAAPAVAEAIRRRGARRVEVAHRFGADHPWEPLLPIGRAALRDVATQLIDSTDDLWRAVSKEATAETRLAAVIHGAVAREAGEGWPARPAPRWLEDVFGAGPRGLPIALPPMPAAYGASSFARALYGFGVSVRLAVAVPSMRFVLAREPHFVGSHRLGFVFAALPSDAEWQVRALGVGRRAANAQSRVLARTALLDARMHAARLLLGDDTGPAPRDLFDELGERVFGAPIDARFRGAWPSARDDEPARFVALLASRRLADDLRDRFDSDWYRNPRAWSELRAYGAGAAYETVDAGALAVGASDLARAFVGALG